MPKIRDGCLCQQTQTNDFFFNVVIWNFACLLLKLLFYLPKLENIYKLVYPLWTQPSIMISGTQIYSTLFWPIITKYAVK